MKDISKLMNRLAVETLKSLKSTVDDAKQSIDSRYSSKYLESKHLNYDSLSDKIIAHSKMRENNVVEFPQTTIYTNNTKPIFLKSNTTYRGHGTVLKTTSVPDTPNLMFPGNTADIMTNVFPSWQSLVREHNKNIVVEGFIIDGSAETTPGDDMHHVRLCGVYQTDNIIIRDCIFRNSYGPYLCFNNVNNVIVENCYFFGGDSCVNGCFSDKKTNITIKDCYFDGMLFGKETISESITFGNTFNLVIENNTIMNKRGTACAIAVGCDTVRMQHNTFKHTGAVLCAVRDTVNFDISENTIYGDNYEYYGIGICCSQGIVSKNKIYDTKSHGIYITTNAMLGASKREIKNDVIIYDNMFKTKEKTTNWCDPIRIDGYGKVRILNNKIISWKTNHFSDVVLAKFNHELNEGEEAIYDVTVNDNSFNDTVKIIGVDSNLKSMEGVTIKLDVNRNTGKLSYKDVLELGFSYTVLSEKTTQS